MIAAVAFGVILSAVAGGAFVQNAKAEIVVGPEVLVSRGEDFAHVETMLAASPLDARHLLASSIILPRDEKGGFVTRSRAYVSRDSGSTWTASALPEESLWDPVVTFTPRGTALLAALLPPRNLLVFRSSNGGTTWVGRTELPFVDGAMIVVDDTVGKHRGRIYLAGRRGEERTDPLVVLHSDDDGVTFVMAVAVEQAIAARAFNPIVLRDGTLFVPFTTLTANRVRQIDAVRSSDGGATFSPPFRMATRRENPRDAGDTPPAVYAAGIRAGRERLYAVYVDYPIERNTRLLFRRSDDGGRTWSEPQAIDSRAADGTSHGAANISVNRRGVIAVSWLQQVHDTYDLMFTASINGGDTFLPAVRVTAASSRPQPAHASRFLPGQDYMLTTADADGAFHLLWPDARAGIFQVYTSAVRVGD